MSAPGRLIVVVGMASEARQVRRARGTGRPPLILIGVGGLDQALDRSPGPVISFGLCGGLDPGLGVGQLVLGTTVSDQSESWSTDQVLSDRLAKALPEARRAGVAGSDQILGDPAAKAALWARTGAGIIDMESHQVGAAAARAGRPFAVLRAVSDGAKDRLPKAASAGFRRDGTTDVLAVVGALLARPWDLGPLLRTAIHAGAAFDSLARAAPVFGTFD